MGALPLQGVFDYPQNLDAPESIGCFRSKVLHQHNGTAWTTLPAHIALDTDCRINAVPTIGHWRNCRHRTVLSANRTTIAFFVNLVGNWCRTFAANRSEVETSDRIELAHRRTFSAVVALVGVNLVRHFAFSGDGTSWALFYAHSTTFAFVRQDFRLPVLVIGNNIIKCHTALL